MQLSLLDNTYKKTSKVPITNFPVEMYLEICHYCHSGKIKKKEKRKHKYREDSQRYYCKNCDRRHIKDHSCGFKLPLFMIDQILDLHTRGNNADFIAEFVMKNTKRIGEKIPLTKQSVLYNIRKCRKLLSHFEEELYHKIESREWQIDDCYQNLPNGRMGYVTNVLAVDTRYWIASPVTTNRKTDASLIALNLAARRAKYEPKKLRSDNWQPHIKAAKYVLTDVDILIKSKEEDISWINYIERMNGTMRNGPLKKRFCFRSVDLLEASAELTRIQYNFLRKHSSLNGRTPAQAAGITIPFRNWEDLIEYAYFLSWYVK